VEGQPRRLQELIPYAFPQHSVFKNAGHNQET
jgi:hypothetical protein